MDEYRIEITTETKTDIREIYAYVSDNLNESNTADQLLGEPVIMYTVFLAKSYHPSADFLYYRKR